MSAHYIFKRHLLAALNSPLNIVSDSKVLALGADSLPDSLELNMKQKS